MSEDEEIIFKGTSLDNYLADLGYADFETFEPDNKTLKSYARFLFDHQVGKIKETISNSVSTVRITEHDYRKVNTILNSKLLLKEDAHFVDSVLQKAFVHHQRTNYVLHTSVVFAGLLSSALMFKSKLNFGVVPVGLSILFSCYSFWQYSNEVKENKKDVLLKTHINDLKTLCLNILKIIRLIKETEVLSSSQTPGSNGSVVYVTSTKCPLEELDRNVFPEWKTLPHLRKCLSDTLEEVLSLLSTALSSLRPSLYDNNLQNKNIWISCEPSDQSYTFSLLELKDLTTKYLFAQSEYLKEISLILFSVFPEDLSSHHGTSNLKYDIFEMFVNLHKKLSNMAFKLNMQHNIHNLSPIVKQSSCEKSYFNSKLREVNEMQNGVHNVFLLLYSSLLRVRSLEDTLENISKTNSGLKSTEKLSLDVIEHLTALKSDLVRTVRCYDVLCQQAIPEKIGVTYKENVENGNNVTQNKVRETGIVVGTSDFTVNSQDEVFLSLSGVNNKEPVTKENVDDWNSERQPQIPKSLLSELSKTLKLRKVNFIEREKQALKRKGLEGIDDLSFPENSDSSEEGSEPCSKKHGRNRMKYKHIFTQDSHSSDSDDEMDPFEDGAFLTKLKISKKYQSDPYSDTDSSVVEFDHNQKVENQASEIRVNNTLVAELVASKSQLWGGTKEECFSDGSDS